MLEIVFEEMSPKLYSNRFTEALRNFHKIELTNNQMEILKEVIDQARLQGLSPSNLATNLAENFEDIFITV